MIYLFLNVCNILQDIIQYILLKLKEDNPEILLYYINDNNLEVCLQVLKWLYMANSRNLTPIISNEEFYISEVSKYNCIVTIIEDRSRGLF